MYLLKLLKANTCKQKNDHRIHRVCYFLRYVIIGVLCASVMYFFLNSQPLRTIPLSFKASGDTLPWRKIGTEPLLHVLGDDVFWAKFSLGMCGLLHLLEMPKFLFTLWGSLSFQLSTNKYTSKNKAKTMHLKVKHTFLKNSRFKKKKKT